MFVNSWYCLIALYVVFNLSVLCQGQCNQLCQGQRQRLQNERIAYPETEEEDPVRKNSAVK